MIIPQQLLDIAILLSLLKKIALVISKPFFILMKSVILLDEMKLTFLIFEDIGSLFIYARKNKQSVKKNIVKYLIIAYFFTCFLFVAANGIAIIWISIVIKVII